MNRTIVASLIAAFAWVGAAAAQENPETQLDFVRKLRGKGWHDLNKEYIEALGKTYPQLAGQLALEEARSLVALARLKSLDQRSAMFNQAREKFSAFVKQYAGKPEALQARLELAKLVAYHGQTLLSKALRDFESPKDQHDAARGAEAMFIQAGNELDAVIKDLTDKEQVQAKFERGVNYMNQARTYLDLDKDAVRRQRGELMLSAKKLFQAMAEDITTEEGFLANAWLVKCGHELQEPKDAAKAYNRVVNTADKTGVATAGQRLARYFYIQHLPKDIDFKGKPLDRIRLIQTEGNKWLKDYPGAVKTWEGQGVRFELANAYLAEATFSFKDFKSTAAQKLLSQAQKHFSDLAELDGEFTEEANRRNIVIAVTKVEKLELKDIRDFENSLLKAYYELYRQVKTVNEKLGDEKLTEAERKKLEAQRKQHLQEAVRALSKAINLATGSTPVQKVDEARHMLTAVYFDLGDLHRAAIAGEALGRVRPPTKRAPQGIGAALLAYDTIHRREPNDANRQRLQELAEYVLAPESQKFWVNDSITGVARYQLAMLAEKDNDYKRALDLLEKLPLDFKGFVYAQGQATFIALGAAKEKAQDDEERRQLRERARAAIKRSPSSMPADADPTTATMYLHSQMEEAKFLYSDAAVSLKAGMLADASAKYKNMGKFVEQHFNSFKKSTLKFEDKTKNDLTTLMTVLDKYAKLGLADVEYRLGNYDKVLSFDLVGPLVQQISEKGKKEGKIRVKDHVVVGEVLGLALRTYVQKNDLEKATDVFKLLDRLAPEGDDAFQADSSRVMFSLIADIERQVKDYRTKKESEKLKSAIENYTKFVDGVKDSILKTKSDPLDYRFLADFYKTLDQPQKAAELYAKIPEPKSLGKKTPNDDEMKDIRAYWYMQIEYAKMLRAAKEYKTAYPILIRLLNHPNGQFHILAEMEKLHILEDNGTLGAAIKGWQELMGRLREKAAQDNDIKKLYFDAYYGNTRCFYLYSQQDKIKQAGKEEQFLNIAANYILKLENAARKDGWNFVGERFVELLEAEPKLKATYEKLKKAAPAGK